MIKRIRDWLVDRHWLHDWEHWKVYRVDYADDAGQQIRQRRSCTRCGTTKDENVCG